MVNIAWTGKHPTQGQDEPKCITPPTHYKPMNYVREKSPVRPDGTCAKKDWNCRLNNRQKIKLKGNLAKYSNALGNLWVKLKERRSLLNDRVLLDSEDLPNIPNCLYPYSKEVRDQLGAISTINKCSQCDRGFILNSTLTACYAIKSNTHPLLQRCLRAKDEIVGRTTQCLECQLGMQAVLKPWLTGQDHGGLGLTHDAVFSPPITLNSGAAVTVNYLYCIRRRTTVVPDTPLQVVSRNMHNKWEVKFDTTSTDMDNLASDPLAEHGCYERAAAVIDYGHSKPIRARGCIALEHKEDAPNKIDETHCQCPPNFKPVGGVMRPFCIVKNRGKFAHRRNCLELDGNGRCTMCSIGYLKNGNCTQSKHSTSTAIAKTPAEKKFEKSCWVREIVGKQKKCTLCAPGYWPARQDSEGKGDDECTNN
jgi:hypothetical protein